MASPAFSRSFLLVLGLVAVLAAGLSAYDASQLEPTDGTLWRVVGNKIFVVDMVENDDDDRTSPLGSLSSTSTLQIGDVIEGINGEPIRSPRHAANLFQQLSVGDQVEYLVSRGGTILDPNPTLKLGSARTTNLPSYLVYCLLGLIYFLVGLYIFSKNSHERPAQLFYLLCCCFLVFFFSATERTAAYYWTGLPTRNLSALSSLLLPPLFLHFFLTFPKRRSMLVRWPWIPAVLYVIPLLFYVDFTHDQFRGDSPAQISALQQVTLGLYFSVGLASLVSTFVRSRDPSLRQRVKFLTLGTVLGVLPFLVFNIAFEMVLGIDDFAMLGAVPMVLLPVSFGYSIARYRLMEVEVIIRRSLIYAMLTGLLVGTYLVIVILVGNVLLNVSGERQPILALFATLVVAGAFARARDRVQGFLERRFFREKFDRQAALQELTLAIPRTLDRRALVELVAGRVDGLLHPTGIAILEPRDGALVLTSENPGTETPLPEVTRILLRRRSPLTPEVMSVRLARTRRDESQGMSLRSEVEALAENGLELLVPALAGDRLVAALALGPKRSEAAYDGAELDLLTAVASQMGMQLENTRLYDEELSRRRLQEELAMARTIQQRLLPSRLPDIPGYDIAALNLPSAEVSGDYYDFVPVTGGRVGLVISDVSGKGMPASLLASNIQASVRALAGMHDSAANMLTVVNDTLYENTDPDRFATLFLGILCHDERCLLYSNAGHNPPLLLRANGSCKWLSEGGTPLGAFPGVSYEQARVDLEQGDLILLYTDGVTEAMDHSSDPFGEDRLEQAVRRYAELPPADLAEQLRRAVFDHAARGNPDDDFTVIAVRNQEAATADATARRIAS